MCIHDGYMEPPAPHRRLMYSVEEAAVLLSLSRAQIYRLMDLQEIGSVTVGRSRRITRDQLAAFVTALEMQAGFRAPK